jgi:hypothetical protein
MISGTTKDRSITKFALRAGRPCHRSIPIANSVPSGTATSTVRTESLYVCAIALRIAASWNNDAVGSPVHQRSDAPCHVTRDRPSLNEKITAIRTGNIDHSR